MKIVNGHARDDKGRPFPWRWRVHLERIDEKPGLSAWICVYPAFSGFVFAESVVQIVGPRFPGREHLVETYRLCGDLAEVKQKARAALDRRQLAWMEHERPLTHPSSPPSFIQQRRVVNRDLQEEVNG